MKLVLYIPLSRWEQVKGLLPESYTIVLGHGIWKNQMEPVYIVTVYTFEGDESSDLRGLMSWVRDNLLLYEDAVLVEYNGIPILFEEEMKKVDDTPIVETKCHWIREHLRDIQWCLDGKEPNSLCPACFQHSWTGHRADCWIAVALEE